MLRDRSDKDSFSALKRTGVFRGSVRISALSANPQTHMIVTTGEHEELVRHSCPERAQLHWKKRSMPRQEVINAIRGEIESRNLPKEAGDRILAFIKQAESSEFPNLEREEQLALILESLPSLESEKKSILENL